MRIINRKIEKVAELQAITEEECIFDSLEEYFRFFEFHHSTDVTSCDTEVDSEILKSLGVFNDQQD